MMSQGKGERVDGMSRDGLAGLSSKSGLQRFAHFVATIVCERRPVSVCRFKAVVMRPFAGIPSSKSSLDHRIRYLRWRIVFIAGMFADFIHDALATNRKIFLHAPPLNFARAVQCTADDSDFVEEIRLLVRVQSAKQLCELLRPLVFVC